jgi:thiol-disulfide isomerase/thioredoxin
MGARELRIAATMACFALAAGASTLGDEPPKNPSPAASEAAPKPVRPEIYDASADGKVLVDAALTRAKKDGKLVLLMYGGNWCGWCYKLHDLFDEHEPIRELLRRRYEVVMIDIGSETNKKLAETYRADWKSHGVPYLTVLNSMGDVVTNQETEVLEVGKRHDPDKVLAFLKQNLPVPKAP